MWSFGSMRNSILSRTAVLLTLRASARPWSEEEEYWICKSLVCNCSIAKSILSKWVVNGGALPQRSPIPKLLRSAFEHFNRLLCSPLASHVGR